MGEDANGAEIELRRIAWELAAASQSQLTKTAAEISELEEELRLLKARLAGQLDAQARLNTYVPRIGPFDYVCPNCWIVDGASVLLKPLPFTRPSEDILRCVACGRDFGISLRRRRT